MRGIITQSEVAKHLGVSRQRVLQLYRDGRIPAQYSDGRGAPYWSRMPEVVPVSGRRAGCQSLSLCAGGGKTGKKKTPEAG